MKIIRTSELTGATNVMDLDITWEQCERFDYRRKTGELIQNIFPNLSAAEREFLLTGITPEEWEILISDYRED